MHTATRLTSAAFQRGSLRFRPYLPSSAFLLPFSWQPSLLETSSPHWRVLCPLRFTYSGIPRDSIGVPTFRLCEMQLGRMPSLLRGLGVRSRDNWVHEDHCPFLIVSAVTMTPPQRSLFKGSLAFILPIFSLPGCLVRLEASIDVHPRFPPHRYQ
jgi:hypothetical protein